MYSWPSSYVMYYWLTQTLHSSAVMLWCFGQPERVWCLSNLPVIWPFPSQSGVGHGWNLFDVDFHCPFKLVLREVLGVLSNSTSVWDVSLSECIIFGLPRFFLTTSEISGCKIISPLFTNEHSWHILRAGFTPFNLRVTHVEWNPLSQLLQDSSSPCWM